MVSKRLRELPIVCVSLVVINIVVFILCQLDGGALEMEGILTVQGVLGRGEYGRLFRYMFLHGDLMHLVNNMVILFFLGAMVEKEAGHIPFAVLYLISGIGGGCISLYSKVVRYEMVGSVGASAAIFGLDGVLLAMVLLIGSNAPTVTPKRVLLMIALSLYSGYSGSNVDNAGHVGGLLTGFIGGLVYCMIRLRRKGKGSSGNRRGVWP